MPRRKLSEYAAKSIFFEALGMNYVGWQVNTRQPIEPQLMDIDGKIDAFSVKVDQGVKGRFKKGLVKLDVPYIEIDECIAALQKKGYSQFVVEPMYTYAKNEERYISFALSRAGMSVSYTGHGGVNVEAHKDAIKTIPIEGVDWGVLSVDTHLPEDTLKTIALFIEENHISFLEINPYIARGNDPLFIDLAVEADDAGAFFANAWSEEVFVEQKEKTEAEATVAALNKKSPASFMLNVLNPNGSVFLLLSGGGASVTIADEIYAVGLGKEIANYGEYSGNPNKEETYLYTSAVVELLIASKARQKVLFIGGAVANFTDIATTFSGVICALKDQARMLRAQNVKVYVRRGGPRQEIGLMAMEEELKAMGILGAVHGPDISIVAAVYEAIKGVK